MSRSLLSCPRADVLFVYDNNQYLDDWMPIHKIKHLPTMKAAMRSIGIDLRYRDAKRVIKTYSLWLDYASKPDRDYIVLPFNVTNQRNNKVITVVPRYIGNYNQSYDPIV